MKIRGFTLTELLAIIVVLGIVVAITAPITTNLIKRTRNNTDKNSIKFFSQAIETEITRIDLEEGEVIEGSFETTDGHSLCNSLDETECFDVDYNGKKVVCETIIIYSDKTVYLDKCTVDDRVISNYSYGTMK